MKSSLLFLIPITGLFLVVLPSPRLLAQWSTSPNFNNAVCTAPDNQASQTIVSDGAGGGIITWADNRSGSNYDIYAQRINAAGTVQWTFNGVAICSESNDQTMPAIVSDGAGGAIITWNDYRSGSSCDIYAQRISSAGNVQWTSNGVAICTASDYQFSPTIASDGAGGAIITWTDYRSGSSYDIYAQRVNAAGIVQWTSNGVAICTASLDQEKPTIVSDGAGGAIITWTNRVSESDHDIYAQRVNADSTVQWTSNGVAICTASYDQDIPTIVSDGAGGAIITWMDYRSGSSYDIYAQRVNAAGTVQWTNNGVAICAALGDQNYPTSVSDGAGGAIITWADYRTEFCDIYAQRISAIGNVRWTSNGVAICTAAVYQYAPTIVSDGGGGAIITWSDARSNSGTDIYAQRINADSSVQWMSNGVVVSIASGSQSGPKVVSDGAGGAIVTWMDSRNGYADIYAQKVDRYGYRGNMGPTIRAVRDVKSDQGGKVVVMWDPSSLDVWPQQILSSYTIYRGVKASTMSSIPPQKVSRTHSFPKATQSANGDIIYWENCATVSPHWLSGYSYPVATLSDSTAKGNPTYYFMVTATAHDSLKYWDSPPDSGYSIDNLPPSAPSRPALVLLAEGSIKIEWKANIVDPDVGGYDIYRSESSGFPPSSGNKLALVSDTLYVDNSTQAGHTYYYRVTTEDIHGNESDPSPELSAIALLVQLTGFNASVTGDRTALIEWTMASEATVFGYAVERRPANTSEWTRVGWVDASATSGSPHHYSFKDRLPQAGDYYYRLNLVDRNGASRISNEIALSVTVPHELRLSQNYPNPFNPSTIIEFTVPKNGRATLTVHDALGKQVAVLFDGETESGRYYEARFDGKDIASGVYLARLTFGDKQVVRKLMLIK